MNARDLARHPLDWLAALLLSWVVPLGLTGYFWAPTYRLSLLFWIVPVVLLLPRFLWRAKNRALRRGFLVTVAYIVIAGSVLDFLLGSWVLWFDPAGDYLKRLPSLSSRPDAFVPIEEIFFYFLGAIAIVLTYHWADDFWLIAYKADARLSRTGKLFTFSGPALAVGAVLLAGGVVVASVHDGAFRVPLYFTFLVVAAFVPAISLYASVKDLVNWRAFSFTALYVLLTSCIWEVTLALPKKWWGYQESAMLGQYVESWQFGPLKYPIEALFVWIVVTFTSVLTFEAAKAYHADDRPVRERLFGSRQ